MQNRIWFSILAGANSQAFAFFMQIRKKERSYQKIFFIPRWRYRVVCVNHFWATCCCFVVVVAVVNADHQSRPPQQIYCYSIGGKCERGEWGRDVYTLRVQQTADEKCTCLWAGQRRTLIGCSRCNPCSRLRVVSFASANGKW